MNVYSIYLKKDYDQFRRRIITESSFALRIEDFDIQENDKVLMIIKKENDSNSNAVVCELKQKNVTQYNQLIQAVEEEQRFIYHFNFNERTFYEFKIVVERDEEVVEESALNYFRYEGIVWNDDAILSDPQFPVLQEMLLRLESAKDNINEAVNKEIRNSEVFGMIVQDELDMIHQEISDFKIAKNKEMDNYVRLKDTQIDEYIQTKNTEIDNYYNDAKADIDELMITLNNLLDNFIADEEGE